MTVAGRSPFRDFSGPTVFWTVFPLTRKVMKTHGINLIMTPVPFRIHWYSIGLPCTAIHSPITQSQITDYS